MTEPATSPQLKIRCPNCQRRLDVTLLEPFSVFPCPECKMEVTVPKWWQEYLLEGIIEKRDGVELYRALDAALDREVMIELVTDAGGYSAEAKEDYLNIIRRLSSLVDPCLCVVYGCGHYDGGVYSILQYSPDVMTKPESHSWAETEGLLKPLLHGLGKVAAEGIFHGRISLTYMRLSESGNVCVTGFGAGMALHGKVEHDGYESPERLAGGEPSLSGDIYSLGKVIWHFLTGALPEEGGVLGEDVPSEIAALLREMMSQSPFDRPKSYDEILQRISGGGESAGSAKKVLKRNGGGMHGKLKVTSVSKAPVAYAVAPVERPRSVLLPLLLVILLVLVAMLSYMLWQQGGFDSLGPEPPPSPEAVPATVAVAPVQEAADQPTPEEPMFSAKLADNQVKKQLNKGIKPLPADLRKRRPRLASPLMSGSKTVAAFVKSLPEEYRRGVEAQVQLIGLSADLLRQYTARIKFDRGPKTRLILYRSGRVLHATVWLANDKGLLLRPVSRSGEKLPKRVQIEDLHWMTYIEMLDYYGKYSYDRFKELPKGTREQQTALKALVHHYLVLTLMCDWYDQRKETMRNAKRCIELQPKAKAVLADFGINV